MCPQTLTINTGGFTQFWRTACLYQSVPTPQLVLGERAVRVEDVRVIPPQLGVAVARPRRDLHVGSLEQLHLRERSMRLPSVPVQSEEESEQLSHDGRALWCPTPT